MSVTTAPPSQTLSGAALEQYQAVRNGGSGWRELSGRGLVEVTGTEAVQFLNGLITNDVKTLEPGRWMTAAFPNVQGRLIAVVRVLRRGDAFLFDTEPETRDAVFQTLYRFSFAGDFHVTDLSESVAVYTLQGGGAAAHASAVFGEAAGETEINGVVDVEFAGARASIIRATHTAEDGFDIFIDRAGADALRLRLNEAGTQGLDAEVFEVLRIEAGIPIFGVDMNATNVVSEVVPGDAVSFTKGCYVGQEIIARIHWRGHVAKQLTGLRITGGAAAPDDKLLTPEGKEVGRITSAAFSPKLDQWAALALVKYDYLAPGTELKVSSASGELPAVVSALPIVNGSWHSQEPVPAT